MSFQFHALDSAEFSHLFELSDKELKLQNAARMIVKEYPGIPCRVSLEDAQIGETVVLVNYEHMAQSSPYRSSHAIYVRQNVQTKKSEIGEVPHLLRHRVLSVRGFDSKGFMQDADLVEGHNVEEAIELLFNNPNVHEIHVHYAKPGCFAAKAVRISD